MDTIDKINKLLAEKQMTGADLGRMLGVSNSVYSQWNTRKTKPRMNKLKQIADILGVTVADLLPDDDLNGSQTKQGATEDEIKFALFGQEDISDELYAEVKRYAAYALEQEKFKKFNQGQK